MYVRKINYTELFNMLSEYNSWFNLTAITSFEEFMVKHVEDSRLGLEFISGRVLDIGSGAGFPALVIKNELPETDVTMTDSVRKKTDFLSAVIERFGLDGARAIHTRIEDFPECESFDTVTARAVARLNVLAEYALPFVRVGGAFVAYKSENIDVEIAEAEKAITLLGGKIERVAEKKLGDDITRKLVIIRKIGKTRGNYPRKGNKPRTDPIT